MLEFSLISVFLVGLLGGGHCIGMCGGIVSAVSMSLPQQSSKPSAFKLGTSKLGYLISYNLGRILSYTIAGGLMGAFGASSELVATIIPMAKILYALSCVMLILLGLYLAGVSALLTHVEGLGQWIWRYLQPIGKRFIPVKSYPQALGLGMVWGWLPCGLVYSVLIAALSSGSPAKGAMLMLCFGLGTLPTLLTMGMAAVTLKTYLQQRWVRMLSGSVIIGFGVMGLIHLITLSI